MEYVLAVLLILTLAFGGSLVLGFFYLWCCTTGVLQALPSKFANPGNKKKNNIYYNRVGGDPQGNDETWMGNGTAYPVAAATAAGENMDWNRESGKSHSSCDTPGPSTTTAAGSTYVSGDAWVPGVGNVAPGSAPAPAASSEPQPDAPSSAALTLTSASAEVHVPNISNSNAAEVPSEALTGPTISTISSSPSGGFFSTYSPDNSGTGGGNSSSGGGFFGGYSTGDSYGGGGDFSSGGGGGFSGYSGSGGDSGSGLGPGHGGDYGYGYGYE